MASGPTSAGGPTGASTPTIPLNWSPSQPACDLNEAGYYVWQWGANQRRLVLGGPAQTSECLPPGWATDATFAATGCPSAYTPVPTGCRWAPEAVVCCPTALAFSCYNSEADPFSGHSYYRCASMFSSRVGVDATWTDMVSSTASVGRADIGTPAHLFALAFVYATPTSPPSDPASPDGNPGSSGGALPDAGRPSDGLSTGVRIGVGVGVGVGVLLAATAVFLVLRRRRRKPPGPRAAARQGPEEMRAELAHHPPYAAAPSSYPPHPVVPGHHEMEGDYRRRSELL